jgi:type IV pilus assembly protein PilB
MFDDHSDVIRDIALEAGLVTPAQAEEIWESHASTGKSFSESLIDAGLADRPTILQAIADHLQVQYYSAVPADPGEALTKLLKAPQAHKYVVLPVADEAGKLTLLAKDPFNSSVISELSFILQKDIAGRGRRHARLRRSHLFLDGRPARRIRRGRYRCRH